jgi:hypothetical protein
VTEGWQVCNCRIRLVTGDGSFITVKSRRWDCPSCGRDKASRIRDLCVIQGAERMWVLTFTQPHYVEGETPARHARCDSETHLYRYSDGSERWRMLESCPHCCAESGRAIANFRKAIRRRWPDAEMLWVREVKPQSGAFDINVVVTGVPPLTRRTRGGRRVKELWLQAGGGVLDLGDGFKGRRSAGGVGRYIGKYLTKFAARPMARGYRRWSRTRGFAAGVPTNEPRPLRVDQETGEILTRRVGWIGWCHPETLEPIGYGLRWWPE